MTSKTRLTLDLKNSESYDNLILHRGDSNSRIIEIELTDNHAPVTLTSGMSATINASTNGIVVADGEKATIDTANNIISFTVTDNMTSLPGQSKISLTVTEGDTVITAQTFRAIVTDAVINEGSKFEPTGGTVKQFMDEVTAARGNFDNLNARFDSKSDKATTLAGYGITDGENIGNKVSAVDFQHLNATDYPNITALYNYHINYVEPCYDDINNLKESKADKATTDELKCYLAELGIQVFESYPYEWMYAIKDIRITDGSTIAIGQVKRTSTRNAIVLKLVENGALSTVKLYANVDSDITGYATYSNSAKTVTMTVNWDEIPYDTEVQFNNNYVLCSAWCYGNTRLEYLLNKAKEEAINYAKLNKLDNTAGSVTTDNIASKAVTADKLADEVKESINGKADKAILAELGIQVFESYPYEWMYAIKDIRITDGSTIAIGQVKRTSTRNAIVLKLVENGALSTVKLYANVDSDITGYATYSNSAKTVTMTVNWDEIPYDTEVQFNNNYVLCSAWCYGNTRLEYLLNKAKEEKVNANIPNTFIIGQNDNVAQVITEAMKTKGSIVYIEPYEHDCYVEWRAFFGDDYFETLSSGRGIELQNDIHIIGRSGCLLTCHYTGNSDYVQEYFSLFNNSPKGSGYTIENVDFDVSKIRYVIHDERLNDKTPYKVRYSRCRMKQDNSESTWDKSRACIGGGLGQHGDVVVEDCIFDTVTSQANMDSLAYHGSSGDEAQNTLVIKNCYCEGNSTLQIASYGASTKKSKVIIANCSFGSPIEELHWDTQNAPNYNMDIFYINNEIRSE